MILEFTEVIITSQSENMTEFSQHQMSLVTHNLPFRGLILGYLLCINKHSAFTYKSIQCGLKFKQLHFPIAEF